MFKTMGITVMLSALTTLACAQSKQDPLEACYQQPDGAPRLACFNREMQKRQSAASTAGPAPVAPASAAGANSSRGPAATTAAAPARPADDTVGLQGEALRKKLNAQAQPAPKTQPIVATIVRMLGRPDNNEHVFVLDNGQSWEQAEAMDNLDVRAHDTVTIKPGMLGAFFLNTPRSQRVRVRRIL